VFGPWRVTVDAIPSIVTYWNNLWVYLRLHGPGAPTLTIVYWSLSLEEQFYLLFPLFLVLLPWVRYRVTVLLAIIVAQLPLDRPEWSLAWAFRSDAIALGVCVYVASRTQAYKVMAEKVGHSRYALVAVATVALVAFVLVPRMLGERPGMVGIVALLAAVLVFAASFDCDCVLPIPGLGGVMDWIGTRSYGLYLAHAPVFNGVWELWYRLAKALDIAYRPGFLPFIALAGLGLLVVITEGLYRWVESPLRAHGRKVARRFEGPAAAGYATR
jgi:peptidoglycan/LPS O-acetylase OafA/YrhL